MTTQPNAIPLAKMIDISAPTDAGALPSRQAMQAAVVMEVHTMCHTTTRAKAVVIDGCFPGYEDMLAALKTMDSHWSDDGYDGPDSIQSKRFSEETLNAWRAIRAAIAKASTPAEAI